MEERATPIGIVGSFGIEEEEGKGRSKVISADLRRHTLQVSSFTDAKPRRKTEFNLAPDPNALTFQEFSQVIALHPMLQLFFGLDSIVDAASAMLSETGVHMALGVGPGVHPEDSTESMFGGSGGGLGGTIGNFRDSFSLQSSTGTGVASETMSRAHSIDLGNMYNGGGPGIGELHWFASDSFLTHHFQDLYLQAKKTDR